MDLQEILHLLCEINGKAKFIEFVEMKISSDVRVRQVDGFSGRGLEDVGGSTGCWSRGNSIQLPLLKILSLQYRCDETLHLSKMRSGVLSLCMMRNHTITSGPYRSFSQTFVHSVFHALSTVIGGQIRRDSSENINVDHFW
ncbi:hypothetical protein TNCV_657511 [Trichonephila clavipes]|nr:hypothetical protein TNCV_657511 [Trichonephila clavipes]